jgi:hypothetical protein
VETWAGPDGLIAAERQPLSSVWDVTSGSLYRDGGEGWTGHPNSQNNSQVFRMVSRERDFGNVTMHVALRVDDLVTTPTTPAQDWDGAHIWVRYQSEYELYAVSVDRRDGQMIIKKKCVGGSDNGGTYYDLNGYVGGAPIPFGDWQHMRVTVRDLPDGSVQIDADRDGLTMSAMDTGIGCAVLHGGGIGVRGDNAELRLGEISVQSI